MTVIAEDDHLTAGAWATCDSNDHTVHFKEHFGGEKCYHIRLISSALFSTHGLIWSELKEIFVFNAQGTQTVKTISEGNNSFKSLGQALQHTMKSEGVKFDMNTLKWLLEIHNPQNKHILLDDDLADLFGIKWRLQTYNLSKWFKLFTNYLVRCHLLGNNENVYNGEPSGVLGCFDIVGQPFDRVTYYSEIPTQRKISHHIYANFRWLISCLFFRRDVNRRQEVSRHHHGLNERGRS